MDLLKQINDLEQEIISYGSQLRPSFLCDEDEYQEQLELRWHLDELRAKLDKLKEDNRYEEEIEGWG